MATDVRATGRKSFIAKYVTLHHKMSRFFTVKGFMILVFLISKFCAESDAENRLKIG